MDKHQFSALDSSGALTKEHLLEVVNRNTKEYLNDSTTGVISAIDDQSFLLRICEIITDVTNDILKQYPDIDKERVYCNLGNLKVIEKKSALDYAAVEPGMILHINQATAQLADLLAGKSMYSVIIHETMQLSSMAALVSRVPNVQDDAVWHTLMIGNRIIPTGCGL